MRKLFLPIFIFTIFFGACGTNTNQIASQIVQSQGNSSTDVDAIINEQCKECDEAATSVYRHPFNGSNMYYCTPHYEHHIEMMNKLFAD